VDIATELIIFEEDTASSLRGRGGDVRAAMASPPSRSPRGTGVGIITTPAGRPSSPPTSSSPPGSTVPELSEASIGAPEGDQFPQAALENPIDVVAPPRPDSAPPWTFSSTTTRGRHLHDFVTAPFTDTHAVARDIRGRFSAQGRKPIVCNFMTDLSQERYRITMRILKEAASPSTRNPTAAAKALGPWHVRRLRRRDIGKPESPSGVNTAKASAVVEQCAEQAAATSLPRPTVYTISRRTGYPSPLERRRFRRRGRRGGRAIG